MGETEELFTESTGYILDPVSPYTLYSAAVAAQTDAGRGPFSVSISVQTLEDGVFFNATRVQSLAFHTPWKCYA